jgi:hypothetical protein
LYKVAGESQWSRYYRCWRDHVFSRQEGTTLIDFKRIEDCTTLGLCEARLQAMAFVIEIEVAHDPNQGRGIIPTETATSRAGIAETHLPGPNNVFDLP